MRRLLAVVLAASVLPCASALAHEGDPNFRSDVHGLTRAIGGVIVEVLNRDDRLLITNRSGRTIVIDGYSDDPYARLLPDGTVQLNDDSAATYLNEERDGQVPVPEAADGEGVAIVEFESAETLQAWREHPEHRAAQAAGRERLFASYRIQVCSVERDYGL